MFLQRLWVLIFGELTIRSSGTGSDPVFAEVGGNGVDPSVKAVPASQGSESLVGFDEHFLGYILSIVEVAKLGVGKSVDTLPVSVHKEAKGFWLSVKTPSDETPVFCAHLATPF